MHCHGRLLKTCLWLVGAAPCPTYLNSSQSWPWHVVLQESHIALCNGSLLGSFWALIPANCVKNRNLSTLNILVRGGHRSLSVDTIIQHPDFTVSPILSNFALIRLSTPVWFTSSIIPICLSQTSQNPTIGSVCSTLAWNASTGDLSGMAGTVTSGVTCLRMENESLYFVPSLSNISFSQKDPGNALVCRNSDGTAYLQGISTYPSNSSVSSSPCLSFTSIGKTINWINSYILT